MIATINMQWLGIGIAALVLVALLIVVLVRHRGDDEPAASAAGRSFAASGSGAVMPSAPQAAMASGPPAAVPPGAQAATPLTPPAAIVAAPPARPPLVAAPAGSFLDEPLVNGFEGLGKVAAPARPEPVSSGPFPVDPFGSHEDIFPAEEPAGEPDTEPADTVAEPANAVAEPVQAAEPRPAEPAAPSAEPKSAATAAEVAPVAPVPADDPALLSDILVTSGSEEVDLADPAVRELLTQLVDDEIELAKVCHAQGETLDAILQLTEAEKASTVLGLDDRLASVKALLAELRA